MHDVAESQRFRATAQIDGAIAKSVLILTAQIIDQLGGIECAAGGTAHRVRAEQPRGIEHIVVGRGVERWEARRREVFDFTAIDNARYCWRRSR